MLQAFLIFMNDKQLEFLVTDCFDKIPYRIRARVENIPHLFCKLQEGEKKMKEAQDEEERKQRDKEAKENEDSKDDEDDEDQEEEDNTQPDTEVSVDSTFIIKYIFNKI